MTDSKGPRVTRAEKVLEARRRGLPFSSIARALNITVDQATDYYDVALQKERIIRDPEANQDLELSRLDRITQGLWPDASSGSPSAVSSILQVMEARRRMLGVKDPSHEMTDAFEATIAALNTTDADTSLIAAGRRIAERIDAATGSLDPVKETKALYLTPHLMTILRELGATPAARAAVKNAKGESGGKLSQLRALRDSENKSA